MDEHFQTTDFWELSKSSNQISVVKTFDSKVVKILHEKFAKYDATVNNRLG